MIELMPSILPDTSTIDCSHVGINQYHTIHFIVLESRNITCTKTKSNPYVWTLTHLVIGNVNPNTRTRVDGSIVQRCLLCIIINKVVFYGIVTPFQRINIGVISGTIQGNTPRTQLMQVITLHHTVCYIIQHNGGIGALGNITACYANIIGTVDSYGRPSTTREEYILKLGIVCPRCRNSRHCQGVGILDSTRIRHPHIQHLIIEIDTVLTNSIYLFK